MEFYDDMQEPYWLDEDYRQISEQYFFVFPFIIF